jgi:hypothetical protein
MTIEQRPEEIITCSRTHESNHPAGRLHPQEAMQ